MIRRLIAALLIVSTTATSLPLHAGMIAADADRQNIAAALERAEVREQLAAFGVDLAEAQARVAALSDAEAAELAARIEALPAGGVDVLAVALVVFLVLLLTDILGYTKIFPFTRPARN
ncbi:MAG TPA: PA2779 family protein [Burkholderiales bacterium]